jgi:hypothetical protein
MFRAYARFGVVVGLMIALLAGAGVACLWPRPGSGGRLAAVLLLGRDWFLDSRRSLPPAVGVAWRPVRGFSGRVGRGITGGPSAGRDQSTEVSPIRMENPDSDHDEFEPGALQPLEILRVRRGEGCVTADRNGGDHAIGQGASPSPGKIEQAGRQFSVVAGEGLGYEEQPGGELELSRRQRPAEEFRPSDRTDADLLAAAYPGAELVVLRRSREQRPHEVAGVEMDHPLRLSRCAEEARRSPRMRSAQRTTSVRIGLTDRCSSSRTSRAELGEGDGWPAAALIARRSASDFDTLHRRATFSRVRTVSTSRAYVERMVGLAIPLLIMAITKRRVKGR